MTKFGPVNGFFTSSHIQEENDKIKDGGGDLHTLSLPPGPDHPCSRSRDYFLTTAPSKICLKESFLKPMAFPSIGEDHTATDASKDFVST